MTSYHDTTNLRPPRLHRAETQARKQEERVMWLFRHERRPMTPSEVYTLAFSSRTPLTSVRRAITNLTEAGKLVKTDEQREGPYGRPEYLWRLADPRPVQAELEL